MIRLKQLREAKHINQQKLAMELNVTQAAISKYEKGLSEPDIEMLKKIASFFHVSVDYLIGFSDVPSMYLESELSIDDIQIINDFHSLNKIKKAKAQAYIQGLLE